MIDAHVHVWTLDADRYPWQPTLAHVPIPDKAATAEDLLDEMEGAGVEIAVLVQPSVYGWDNSYLCDCLERHPGRFVGVCLVDPHARSASDDLRHWCRDRGCTGLRLNLVASPDADWILESDYAALLDAVSELGIPVELQTLPLQAGVIIELARRYSQTTFIIDYLGRDAFGQQSGRDALIRITEQPNTAFKLLALSQDSTEPFPFRDLFGLYETALSAFSASRIVFGTDFPHVRERSTYAESVRWLSALPFMPDDALADIGDANARRLFRPSPTRTEDP